MSSAAILQEVRNLREMGTVLFVAAHPDDENTRLITYLSRVRGCRIAYLSLTRGDGGQNLLGTELREALGVIRTQELLAARRIDGGEQFFTRANDFGFSKTPVETLAIWDREAVLGDVVRVVRTYRPDVIMMPFSPQSAGDTHGHHTASAILALEAFNLAGNPQAYPEQLRTLQPWQATRVIVGRYGPPGRPASEVAAQPGTIQVDLGGYNALLGESIGETAARSRTMHKSQGFGSVGTRGTSLQNLQTIAGESATNDIFDGVATSWTRVPGGAAVGGMINDAIAKFDAQAPVASVPALLAIRSTVAALPADALVIAKRRQLDRILQACLGLYVETTLPEAEVVAGEELKLRHSVIARADFPVRWVGVRYPGQGGELTVGENLQLNTNATRESARVLPADTPPSQPYWLREPGTLGTYRVDDPALIGQPENPPVFPVEHVFEVAGQTLIVADEPVQVIGDRVKGEIRRRLEVIPPASLAFTEEVGLFAPGATRAVTIEVEAARTDVAGSVQIETPAGWNVVPTTQPFRLGARGERARVSFDVTAPARPETAAIVAKVEIGDRHWHNRRVEIRYDHIPPLLLQPLAQMKAVSLQIAIRGRTLGYVPGAGDLVAEGLARMGYTVAALADADLTAERLRGLDAVVVGIRAFSSRPELAAHLPALFAYVENGGNLIVQYNTPERALTDFAPLTLRVARNERVTDENAAMSILAPDHPALNVPNRITADDFAGWVQERGLYFPTEWDARFTPLLACADPGESAKNGSLIVARHGKGYFVYTGLSFFRQLPEGVPGAYRLMANLVSLGKE
jgi:LmbE family N-acetylglucosaminyl deacetylase